MELNSQQYNWKNIISAYEKTEEGEEDGIYLDNITDEEEDEQELKFEGLEEALEDNQSYTTENKDRRLQPYTGSFASLSLEDKYHKLSYDFDHKVIAKLVKLFQQRCKKVDRMNLPFWNTTIEG